MCVIDEADLRVDRRRHLHCVSIAKENGISILFYPIEEKISFLVC